MGMNLWKAIIFLNLSKDIIKQRDGVPHKARRASSLFFVLKLRFIVYKRLPFTAERRNKKLFEEVAVSISWAVSTNPGA